MRSIWKGSLAFGLVNVPIKVYSATEDKDISFHQVHAKDGGRIRYQRTCELDGEVVEFSEIAKAYESDDGRSVILTKEDFDSLPVEESHEIEVLSFVPVDQVDTMLYDKSYYLEPASKSVKAYELLRQTLLDTDRLAIVHFALRQKTRLAALRVRGDVLTVQTLLWPDEVREASFDSLDTTVKISAQEKQMASMLVDSFAADFEPGQYTDTYREELEQLIQAKLDGGEAFTAEEPESGEDAEVVDLLAALQRSMEKRGGAAPSGSKSAGTSRSKAKSEDDEEQAATGTDSAKPTTRRRASKAKS
jgi:DNA end-binding protein Ku